MRGTLFRETSNVQFGLPRGPYLRPQDKFECGRVWTLTTHCTQPVPRWSLEASDFATTVLRDCR